MLLTTEIGHYKIRAFLDRYMHRLYEKFVLEHFKRHRPYLSVKKATRIKWNLDTKLGKVSGIMSGEDEVYGLLLSR